MQATQTASRVRHWAGLGMKANKAHYGLQRFADHRQLDASSRRYLQDGLELCKRLVEGAQTKKDDRITEVSQLAAVADVEPTEIGVTVEQGKPEQVLKTFEAILQEPPPHVPEDQLKEASAFLLKVSDAYTTVAFKELEDLEGKSEGAKE